MTIRYYIGITLLLIGWTGCAQNNDSKSPLITKVVEVVTENHIAPKVLDDQLSKQIFHAFLQKIDREKHIFTADEVEQLKSAEQSLDDELKNGTTRFFSEATEILFKGIERAEKYVADGLKNKIEIFKVDQVESNDAQGDFVKNENLKKRWESTIRKQWMEELYISEIVHPDQTFEAQKAIALKKTKLFFQDYFYKLKSQTREDLLEDYLNAYLFCNDYQSSFLSPETREEWDTKFNRNFVGVGLVIETTIDYPVIKEVLFDGPAWKTKKIDRGDVLRKISNSENQLMDVAGLPLSKIIELLKGEKGSKVVVNIKKADHRIEEVEIERGQVALSKTMSFIIKEKNANIKIGYIYLPRFYTSEEGAAADVLAALNKLKKEQVEGIILDLRNNQGGSAGQAREIVGYFLKGERVMHMMAKGNHRTFEDDDPAAQYAGKLLVMVNEKSSSASELVSGNLQDYQKAIIVGSQTFGKGTAQNFFDIINEESAEKLGDVKLTIARFYTGNGRTPQYHGIVPDIILPSENRYVETGERAEKNALKFENLTPTFTSPDPEFEQLLSQLEKLSKTRQAISKYFQQVEKKALLKKVDSAPAPLQLNYDNYKKEKEKFSAALDENNLVGKLIVNTMATSEFEEEKTKYRRLNIENDEYLYESMLIMQDFLKK